MSVPVSPFPDPLARALDEGRAYAELDELRLTRVAGSDAGTWLHDLVTTDVASLTPLRSRPSMLLTPTGRIRATFHVIAFAPDELVLAQPSGQPSAVDELLRPYVLSSDVDLRPAGLLAVAVPGRDRPPSWAERASRPSVLGGGFDLLLDAEVDLDAVRARLAAEGLERTDPASVEARRVVRGEARFPVDLDTDSLPAEAGWDADPLTDRGKGCFLGQESVAKVANLGHPPRVVIAIAAAAPLAAGTAVSAGGTDVGRITSAVGSLGFARVRWEARDEPLHTSAGVPLRRR